MAGSNVVTSVSHRRRACSPASAGEPARSGLPAGGVSARFPDRRPRAPVRRRSRGGLGCLVRGVLGEAQMHQRRPGLVTPPQSSHSARAAARSPRSSIAPMAAYAAVRPAWVGRRFGRYRRSEARSCSLSAPRDDGRRCRCRVTVLSLEHQPPFMERGDRRPMRNGDQRGIRQTALQDLVEAPPRLPDRGWRLPHRGRSSPAWPTTPARSAIRCCSPAGEAHAASYRPGPAGRRAAAIQRRSIPEHISCSVKCVHRVRIGDHMAQAYPAECRAAAAGRTSWAGICDLARAERPDAGQDAEQRGLAGAGSAGDDHRVAGGQRQIGVIQQLRPIRQGTRATSRRCTLPSGASVDARSRRRPRRAP